MTGPKAFCRKFFDDMNRQLDASPFGGFACFLNFGYVTNDNPEFAALALPEHDVNKSSAKLLLEVIGDCNLNGLRVLDVGCGRGGGANLIRQFFEPRQYIGMDLSGLAAAFCVAHHRYADAVFLQGDAERLPFADNSIDVVINVESSQSYPDIRAFYCEVFRVLRPGGHFLYSDVLPLPQMAQWIGLLSAVGFQLERDRDVTSNVLLSCDDVARRRVGAYSRNGDAALMANFLGAPGSQVYEEMKNGRWSYRILKLQKSVGDLEGNISSFY